MLRKVFAWLVPLFILVINSTMWIYLILKFLYFFFCLFDGAFPSSVLTVLKAIHQD